ncbi:2-octaprenyl-6-methoxyphenyl hydroxylase [Parashewanella curva]|uniref:2-octaprenyl-6-methoxyphenyl hydroxylase n=1 Tax=Parashewanella curva TaxID=2338552 RepID=A0A3L8PU81_9GAMM|nr:2-octaprenyl-6-methoxyphenyl hydroxylase [Parashewanella curva]RLV58864.1 2-octaprenyl-6-methoxyphenyl hydroxylase [Parashewanella curva]
MSSSQQDNATTDYDIAIIGGAMVGSVLALGLVQLTERKLKIALIEAVAPSDEHPGFDARSIALAHHTIKSLKEIGVWSNIENLGTPINHIHISDRGNFGMTQLNAGELNVDYMGQVVELAQVGQQLYKALQQSAVNLFCPNSITELTATPEHHKLTLNSGQQITAKLVVAADGVNSVVRQQLKLEQQVIDFNQSAIIANIACEQEHQNRAWERFTNTGPLALLPMRPENQQNRLSLVWALSPETTNEWMSLPKSEFLSKLQHAFGFRAGQFIDLGERFSYPLKLSYMPRPIHHRCVFVGNAAQTLHPIAGQGFNLGMRDILALIKVISRQSNGADVGSSSVTHGYLKLREQDRSNTINRIEFLVRGFSNDLWPMAITRNLSLRLLSYLPPLKAPIAKAAMGYTTA